MYNSENSRKNLHFSTKFSMTIREKENDKIENILRKAI